MSEREYVKFNTSVQVASNSQGLIKDDDGNIAAILELRLPDNIFPAENGNKKVDSVQMLTTKMRISMENTPIAQFDVDEDTMKKLEKLNRSSNAAFITTSQMDLYPYVIKGDNQILPTKANSAFPFYKSCVISIDISVWMGEDYITLDTLYVHPNAPSSFAEDVGRYKEPFQKGGVFATLNHLSNLVVKQYMPVRREDDVVSIFNVGSIEQMLQDGIESAFIYNNTNLVAPLQYSIFFISEEAYNNNHFPPVEDDDFTKNDVDVENTMIIEELGGIKAYFVNKVFGPNVVVEQAVDLPNIRFSVKPKVSFTEQKLRISYDTAPFTTNIPLLWCNSFVNTYDNPLQLTLGNVYSEYCDGFKPPKRVFSYGATKNEDDSYFFTLKESTINPINIVGNKDLRDTFSCLPWITVDTNTNGFFSGKAKAKYRIKEQSQLKTSDAAADVVTVTRPQSAAGTACRQYGATGLDCTSIDTALTANCLVYTFTIPKNVVNINGTTFNERYPKTKRTGQIVEWGTDERKENYTLNVDVVESRSNISSSEIMSEMKTYNQYECNYNRDLPSTNVEEIYSSTSTVKTNLPAAFMEQACCGIFNINGEDRLLLYDIPEGSWTSASPWRCWLPPTEPNFISAPEESGDNFTLKAYWNLTVSSDGYDRRIVLVSSSNWNWWVVSYEHEDVVTKTYYKQNIIETLTDVSIDELLFNFLPNVDLDEKGRFYVLDGTTTNLSMGQQEVIEGPTNTLYNITTNTTITHYARNTTERWKGTKDGTPYEQLREERCGRSNTGMERIECRYQLIDMTQPDEPSNRTNQWIRYIGISVNNRSIVNVEVISAASLQHAGTIQEPTVVETHETHETTSSTEYPEGETVLPSEYTNWHVVDNTQIILSSEETLESLGINALNRETMMNLVNSDDTYWDIESGYVSNNPLFRCIPTRPCDSSTSLDGGWIQQVWELPRSYEMNFFIRKQITSSNIVEEQRDRIDATVTVAQNSEQVWYGNIRLNFEWDNIPIVVISPIQSIVLTLQGMNVSQEIQPINVAQPSGSSLVSTIPIIENYYSLAQTLRDLHDELVVIKDSYDDQATYSLNTTSGQERALRIMAQYITKDGRLHQIYIPPNGVYSLQLTFGIAFYFSS